MTDATTFPSGTARAVPGSRNLVLCLDGTNNEFGPENTSIVRLVQALDGDPALQRVFYDPCVGTLPEPGLVTPVRKWFVKVASLAFGYGLKRNVEEAYTFLMETWEPGDEVFVFGFSRGAYTARAVGGPIREHAAPPLAVSLVGPDRRLSATSIDDPP